MAFEQMNSNQRGRVSYNKTILLSIINLAAKEISGVAGLCTNFGGSKLGRLFSTNYYEGVKITSSSDGLNIDVYINIYANNSVADVACRVQENVRNSVISMTEANVKSINIHVMGVEFDKNDL